MTSLYLLRDEVNDHFIDHAFPFMSLPRALKLAGYDDVLSIEHEDMMMSPMEGMRKSVDLLRRVAINLGQA